MDDEEIDTSYSSSLWSSLSSVSGSMEDEDDEEEEEEDDKEEEEKEKEDKRGDELELLRHTVKLMNTMIKSNTIQFGRMARRIEELETVLKKKRKRTEGDDEEEEEEEEDEEALPYIKQKTILDDESATMKCKNCDEIRSLEEFDRTSSRKKDITQKVKVYYYRRKVCKECCKTDRQKRLCTKQPQIKAF